MPPFIAKLIQQHWSHHPLARPSFAAIRTLLEDHEFRIFLEVDSGVVSDYFDAVQYHIIEINAREVHLHAIHNLESIDGEEAD
jgi:pyoverdine/dityrosine biosynthesis protein Dit1